ncbi:MAG TPA: hypothetical protein VIP77_19935 [Jiangellaceae bacterium]
MRRLLTALALPLIVVAPVLAGCSEQIDQTINNLASKALDAGIRDELDRVGITLADDPECTTDFNRDGTTLTGNADCTAETTGGEAVDATFDGTLEPSGCSGSLVVSVAGEQVVDVAEIPDCSVNL